MTSAYQSQINNILSQINSSMSLDAIRQLVSNEWDMSVGNGTVLLYSGGVGDPTQVNPVNGDVLRREYSAQEISEFYADKSIVRDANGNVISQNVKTIADTEVEKFLSDLPVSDNGAQVAQFWLAARAWSLNSCIGKTAMIM